MFAQYILSYLRYLSAARKQHSSKFSLSCRQLETRTTDVQTMSGPQTLETRERAACRPPCFAVREECCSLCEKISWHFTEAQEDGYSWHSCPLLSGKEMGTSHSKLPTERESWILLNLHFNSYSTQKCQEPLPCKMIHWKPERGEEENMWKESYSGGNRWAAEIIWGNISGKLLLCTWALLHLRTCFLFY